MQREAGDKERLAALGQLAKRNLRMIGDATGCGVEEPQLAAFDQELGRAARSSASGDKLSFSRVSKIIRDHLDHTRRGSRAL